MLIYNLIVYRKLNENRGKYILIKFQKLHGARSTKAAVFKLGVATPRGVASPFLGGRGSIEKKRGREKKKKKEKEKERPKKGGNAEEREEVGPI